MSPSLFLGSLVVAGVLSGLLNTSQAPAGEAHPQVPVSEALPTAIGAASIATRPATPELAPQDLRLEESTAVTLLQFERADQAGASADVVCGMKLWRVNPGVDTGIHRQIPEEAFNAVTRRISPNRSCGASARGVTRHSFAATIHSPGGEKPDPQKPDPPVRK